MANLSSIKTVIRCRDFRASYDFYHAILNLPVMDQWEEASGKGCIFEVGGCGLIEIYEMTPADPRYRQSFALPVPSEKIDVQLRTESVDEWVCRLQDIWDFEGPQQLAWGQRWIQLRDPDNLLIAIYEGQG